MVEARVAGGESGPQPVAASTDFRDAAAGPGILGPVRRTDPDAVELPQVDDLPAPAAQVVAALAPMISDERMARIDAVIASRIGSVVPVLEEMADPHNGAAVLRTADALGIHELHVIEARNRFLVSRGVARGTAHWLDLRRHRDGRACIDELRARQFRVLVASTEGTIEPEELARIPRVAIVFGNEHAGVSPSLRERVDGVYRIPMRGFVESLNVSVAAAITLWAATRARTGDLGEAARTALRARFMMSSVREAGLVVREIVARHRGT